MRPVSGSTALEEQLPAALWSATFQLQQAGTSLQARMLCMVCVIQLHPTAVRNHGCAGWLPSGKAIKTQFDSPCHTRMVQLSLQTRLRS